MSNPLEVRSSRRRKGGGGGHSRTWEQFRNMYTLLCLQKIKTGGEDIKKVHSDGDFQIIQ